ncbi:bifunctional phosphoserine phosphatase/homoserine phosphotransferase ThrH [Rugamonas rubra]|jgi:phosphoserine/homoserine phosphotransferase|uniref:phosphoserine phosphatase n=1 Tax=Rugamonas rubra TaxID=758825 RepID=A0A1I4Q3S2_9BURK|nr:bifunctional phosphoserine phosphatase/homoserine phosphotransferase ThrH [Rugamonas rubra]SFM34712.1 phosphoserine / homoserine phosphotransferase [Rugamonas rubra]
MNIACIDLEGVLVPEMWPHVGQLARIPGLAVTTREEPDYPRLMLRRIALLRRSGLRLVDVQRIVATLRPLYGAAEFLAALRRQHQVLVLSDAFVELAAPFVAALGTVELQCHRLSVDADGFIDGCCFLPRRGKEETVQQLQQEGHRVLAVGDALNDLAMLRQADLGFLFQPSPQTLQVAGDLRVALDYDDILAAVARAAAPAERRFAPPPGGIVLRKAGNGA